MMITIKDESIDGDPFRLLGWSQLPTTETVTLDEALQALYAMRQLVSSPLGTITAIYILARLDRVGEAQALAVRAMIELPASWHDSISLALIKKAPPFHSEELNRRCSQSLFQFQAQVEQK